MKKGKNVIIKNLRYFCPVGVIALGLIMVIATCGGDGDGEEGVDGYNVIVTGHWVETYSTSIIPLAQIIFDIEQTGANVTGTYSTSTGVHGIGSGTFSGTVSGNTITYTLNQTTPNCTGTFNGSANVNEDGNAMTSTFTGFDCAGTHNNGRGNVTKQ